MKLIKISNKKANLLSIWWFAILTIIGIGIVAGVLIFSSGKITVRAIEANILANRVIDCVSQNGYLTRDFLFIATSNFDIFKSCYLDKDILNKPLGGDYYIRIEIKDGLNSVVNGFPLIYGNQAFEKECIIGESMVEAKYFPRCVTKSVALLNPEDNNKFILTITTGSNHEFRLGAKK